MTTETFTSTTTWTCPAWITTIDVVCWGQGGAGGADAQGEGGGGGGGYSATTGISVTPGATYTITVDSTKSAFGADVVRANAGQAASGTTSGNGASTTGAVGTIKYGGGYGGYTWTVEGGGGGGAGGPSGNGGNANGKVRGTGNGTGAGAGGNGGLNNTTGGNGANYGGGAGGGGAGKNCGQPGAGAVLITYASQFTIETVTGSLSLAGQAATIRKTAYVLAAEPAAFALIGVPINADYPSTVYRVMLRWSAGSTMDVTDHTLSASWERSVSDYGRGLEIGTADVVLTNDTGSLSPLNLPSNLFRPGVGLTIEAAPIPGWPYKTIFTGFVDRISVAPALASPRNVTVSCRDRMRDLAQRRIQTSVLTEVNVGSLVTTVLDAAAVTARSIDAIGDTIPFAWFQDRQVTGVVEEIIDAGGYAAYVAGDGTFRFRDRFFDLGGTVVASYAEMGAMTWELDDSGVVNSVRVRGEPRTVVSSVQPVALLTDIMTIPAGQSVGFFLEYQDPRNQEAAPALEIVTPVASLDWTLNGQADNSGAVLTGSASLAFAAFAETCVATVTNGSSTTGYLTLFQVRGQPVQREAYLSVLGESTASQSLYGVRDGTLETRLIGTRDRLETRASDIIDLFAEPTPKVSMTLTNVWPDVVDNDLADLVHITEPITGTADQFTIRSISHQLDAESGAWVHSVTYGLERSKAISPLILDDTAAGLLDEDRLGRDAA